MPIRINSQTYESTINTPSAEPHGTYYLADNPSIYELQRNNTFEFVVTDLEGLVPAGEGASGLNATWPNPQEVLRLSVTSAAIPHFTQNEIPVSMGNSTLYYAGTPQFQAGSFVFKDFIGA